MEHNINFTAIDFETGCGRRNSACAVAMAIVNDGVVSDTYSSLICPPDPEMDFAMINIAIHGITPGMVRNEPDFRSIWNDLYPRIENTIVVAHNASFDMSVLRALLDYYNLPYPRLEYACTLQMARSVFPSLSNHRLDTVAEYLDIDLDHHNALSDARASAMIALECMKRSTGPTPETMLKTRSF